MDQDLEFRPDLVFFFFFLAAKIRVESPKCSLAQRWGQGTLGLCEESSFTGAQGSFWV